MPFLLRLLLPLLVLAAAFPAQADPRSTPCEAEVGLNHFYVVLDAATFEALRAAEDLAALDAGLPAFAAPDAASQRVFLRGRTTYVELFRPDNRFGEPVGKVGLALGVDRPEDLDCVERRWAERLEGETGRRRVERTTDEGAVPWYDAVFRPETSLNDALVVWAVGYRPEFVPWLYPDNSPGVRRADVLAPRFDPERLLEDVTGLTVAVPEELLEAVAAQLEAVGYEREEVRSRWGGRPGIALRAGGWALTLLEETAERRGLLAVEFATTREVTEREVRAYGPRWALHVGPGRRAVLLR